MKKILITGSGGFIGKALYDNLNKNHAVYKVDRKNILEYTDKNPDVIIHCAANSIIREGGVDVWDSNVKLTHNMLEGYTRRHIKKPLFINLSSIAVYGVYPLLSPPYETSVCRPTTVYGMSKLAAEFLVNDYHKKNEVDGFTLRLGGVCGPNMTHGILKRIIQSFKEGKESIDFINPAPGNNMSYVHIDTVVEVINKIIDDPPKHLKNQNVMNVTATKTLNITEIVELFNKTLGKNMKINWTNVPKFVNDDSIFIGNTDYMGEVVKRYTTCENLERTIKECLL